MSLIVAVYVPTGIVLSGDSRTTGTRNEQIPDPQNPGTQIRIQTNITLSDAADKIFLFHNRFGAGIFGEAIINNLPIAHYMENFQAQSTHTSLSSTQHFANLLLQHFQSLQPVPQIGILVGGYDQQDPWVMSIDVRGGAIQRVNLAATNQIQYGIVRGGDTAVVDRLLSQPQFNPPFQVMNLQDAVDYSRHLIRTTIDQMKFEPRFATVGGFIDTVIITSGGARFLAHKSLTCS